MWLLLTLGAAVTVGLGAVLARQVLDVPWSLAWLLASVLVVTGPTVIGPLVRALGLKGRLASILEAEGTLIDPLGAILSVLVFQAFYENEAGGNLPLEMLATLGLGAAIGAVGAWLLTLALARFIVPDELHNVFTLAVVIAVFAAADHLQPEAGLVAVTVMGFVVASQQRVEVRHVLEFNETLRILFISSLFVLLGARIASDTLRQVEWQNLAFLALLIVVVRPLSVALSTLGSGLSRAEKLFMAATAPRGIVAAAVASIFSLRLAEQEQPGSQVLVSATFTVIAGTVLLSGLGARPLARRLGLISETIAPVVILGTNQVAVGLAQAFGRRDMPVRLISLDRREVSSARLSGLVAVRGSVLDERIWHQIDADGAATFVALTGNDEANAIACRRAAPLVGRRNVFRIASDRKEHAPLRSSHLTPGRLLIGDEVTFHQLEERMEAGWFFRATRLTETYGVDDYRADQSEQSLVFAAVRSEHVDFAAAAQPLSLRVGDVVIALVPLAEGDESDQPESGSTPPSG